MYLTDQISIRIYFVKNNLEYLSKFVYSVEEVIAMSFGERLLKVLDSKNMTRADLCRLTGLKSSYLVGYIKNPDRSPTLSTACRIALALDVSLDYLGGLIDDPRPLSRDELGDVLPGLSSDEETLLEAYRRSDERGQGNILFAAEREKTASAPDVVRDTRQVG